MGWFGLARLLAEARKPGPHVALAEAGARVDRARQIALPEWAPRHEPDAEFLAGRQDRLLGVARP
jgi:hypothetical protein